MKKSKKSIENNLLCGFRSAKNYNKKITIKKMYIKKKLLFAKFF